MTFNDLTCGQKTYIASLYNSFMRAKKLHRYHPDCIYVEAAELHTVFGSGYRKTIENLLICKDESYVIGEEGTTFDLKAKDVAESASAYVDLVPEVDGLGNITFNMNADVVKNARILLTDDSELNIQNLKNGSEGNIIVTQGADAPWLLRIRQGAYIGNNGGGVITLSTDEGMIDVLSYSCDGDRLFVAYSITWTNQGN